MVRYWLRTSPAEVKSGSVLVVCLRHLTVFFFFSFKKLQVFCCFSYVDCRSCAVYRSRPVRSYVEQLKAATGTSAIISVCRMKPESASEMFSNHVYACLAFHVCVHFSS